MFIHGNISIMLKMRDKGLVILVTYVFFLEMRFSSNRRLEWIIEKENERQNGDGERLKIILFLHISRKLEVVSK